MDAVNPIDKLNEAKRLQQALRENPNDIDSQLKLAPMIKDLELRRKVLNKTLSLDPANKQAREMLLELDRAEMTGNPSQAISSGQVSRSHQPAKEELQKTLVFRYSLIHQIIVYLLIAFAVSLCWQARQDPEVLLVFGAFLFALVIPLWFVSVVVRVSGSGLNISRLFGVARWEIPWSEIKSIKQNAMGQGIKIITNTEKVVEISSQLHGYSSIVQLLMTTRPDLSNPIMTSQVLGRAPEHVDIPLTDTKIFQKSSLAKYGPFFVLILACVISAGSIFVNPAALLFLIGMGIWWFIILTAPHTVAVEGNRLWARSFHKQWDLTADQIENIDVLTLRDIRHRATTYVRIQPVQGKAFKCTGFPGGTEMMYGFLRNWWKIYKNS